VARHNFQGALAIECFTDRPLSTACEVGDNPLTLTLREIPEAIRRR
jgi:hypothetical protein